MLQEEKLDSLLSILLDAQIERPEVEEYQGILHDGYGNSDMLILVSYIEQLEELLTCDQL